METQKTPGIETQKTPGIEEISVPKDSELSAQPRKNSKKLNKGNEGISVLEMAAKDSELSAQPGKDSEKLNKGNEGVSVLEMAAKDSELSVQHGNDSEKLNKGNDGDSVSEMAVKDSELYVQHGKDPDKLNKNKGKRVNAGNKGIVEKMKREITKLNETVDRMTTEYDKLDAKNQNLEKIIDTMAKETDEWRNKYIELLKHSNNERQEMFAGYTQLYDRLSRSSFPPFDPHKLYVAF